MPNGEASVKGQAGLAFGPVIEPFKEVDPGKMTLENYDPDPGNILFNNKWAAQTPEQKEEYKTRLKTSVEIALRIGLKGDLSSIYEDIVETKNADPNDVSLFAEIQSRLIELDQDPENFKVRVQGKPREEAEKRVLSLDEQEQVKKGLKFAREIIFRSARESGVFRQLDREIRRIQSNPNYERAIQELEKLKDPFRFGVTETQSLNRSSPDFSGISLAYIDSHKSQMENSLSEAVFEIEIKNLEKLANEQDQLGNLQKAESLRRRIEDLREGLKTEQDSVETLSLIGPRAKNARKARVYLERKARGEVSEEPPEVIVGAGRRRPGESDDEMLRRIYEEARAAREVAERQAVAAEKQAELAEKQYELWKRGYSGAILAIVNRTRLSPEQFDQASPLWYERLSREEQGMIRTMLHVNYLATIVRDTCQETIESWVNASRGIRIERENLKNMWEKMPGFRMAMATLAHDLFESKKVVFVEGKRTITDEAADHFVLSEKGYEILQDYEVLRKYKDGVAKNLANYMKNDREAKEMADEFAQSHSLEDLKNEKGNVIYDKYELLAQLAVNGADNLYFSTGAYASADEYRPYDGNTVRLLDDNVTGDALKAFFSPGRKAFEQMTEPRTGMSPKAEGAGRVERLPLGPLGDWVGWNVIHTPGYREKMQKGELNHIPQRMYYSLLDQTDVEVDGKKISIAEMLIRNNDKDMGRTTKVSDRLLYGTSRKDGEKKGELEVGLYDFQKGKDHMDLGTVSPSNLHGDYADERSASVKLFNHLVSSNPNDRIRNSSDLVNSLAKLRKHRKLNDHYNDENFIKAAVGMMISPEKGFVIGREMILDIDQSVYMGIVNQHLRDERLFWGSPKAGRLRKELLRAYKSGDENSYLDILKDIYIENTIFAIFSERQRKLWNTKRERERILQEMGAA